MQCKPQQTPYMHETIANFMYTYLSLQKHVLMCLDPTLLRYCQGVVVVAKGDEHLLKRLQRQLLVVDN